MNSTGRNTARRVDPTPPVPSPPRDTRSPDSQGTNLARMPRRTWGWFLLAIIVNYLLFRSLLPSTAPVAVPYTFFKEQVRKDNVKAIYSQGQTVTGKFSSAVDYPPPPSPSSPADTKSTSKAQPKKVTDFTTILPTFVDPGLEAFLIEHKVEISAEPIQEGNSPLATLIFGVAPALLLIGFYVWMFRRAGQQGGGMGGLM